MKVKRATNQRCCLSAAACALDKLVLRSESSTETDCGKDKL